MRRVGIYKLFIAYLFIFLMGIECYGQEIFGKAKNNYRNFASKKTMVVVNEADFMDLSLMDAVKSGWRISLYDFCSHESFERDMRDTNLYFLLRVEGKFSKGGEAALEFLTLVKGGPEAVRGIGKMEEIVSLPLRSLDDESGKAFIFMPAFLEIMQEHIASVSSDIIKAYLGNSIYSNRVDEIGDKVVVFDRADIGYRVSEGELREQFGNNVLLGDEDDVAAAMKNAEADRVVSYTVSPGEGHRGGYSYKMLIEAHTSRLIFFRRHRVSSKYPGGFTEEDLRRISVPFRVKR